MAVSRPRLLDIGCGLGGASAGYDDFFDVTGLDIEPQPHYPFKFIQADALTFDLDGYDAYHGSLPCQLWCVATLGQRRNGVQYQDLITPMRPRLQATGKPWVMENVPQAPLRPDIELCGCMFGLEIEGVGYLKRGRVAETSWGGWEKRIAHQHRGRAISISGHGTPAWQRKLTGHIGVALWREVMGISWGNRDGLTEAIPPAYGRYLGERLLAQVLQACPAR